MSHEEREAEERRLSELADQLGELPLTRLIEDYGLNPRSLPYDPASGLPVDEFSGLVKKDREKNLGDSADVAKQRAITTEAKVTSTYDSRLINAYDFIATANMLIVPAVTLCAVVTVPPLAPFDVNFGAPGAGGVTMSVNVPVGCATLTCEFNASIGNPVIIEVWTGSAIDTGERLNFAYWNSDERAASSLPSSSGQNANPTGLLPADGFISGGISGDAANNPQLFLLTGFESDDVVTVNVKISVIGA